MTPALFNMPRKHFFMRWQKNLIIMALIAVAAAGCNTSRLPAPAWQFRIDYPVIVPPVIDGQSLYVASDELYCLDAASGRLRWKFRTLCNMTYAPRVSGGRVFVQSGGLYCLDAATGALLWEYWREDWADGTPAVDDQGNVYIIIKHMIYCIDAASGRLKGKLPACPALPNPTATDGRLYIACTWRLSCIDTVNGTALWTTEVNGVTTPPVISQNRVYAVQQDTTLLCLDGATGAMLWTCETGGLILGHPVVADQRVYVKIAIRAGKVLCLDAVTGQAVWDRAGVSRLPYGLCVSGGRVYVRDSGKISCFDAQTGAPLASGSFQSGALTVSDAHIFVSTNSGISCFRIDDFAH